MGWSSVRRKNKYLAQGSWFDGNKISYEAECSYYVGTVKNSYPSWNRFCSWINRFHQVRHDSIKFENISNEYYYFCRLNAFFAKELTKYQPISENKKITLNSLRYRGLDGFVAAVSPFNFTAIGGNLAYTPALMVIYIL